MNAAKSKYMVMSRDHNAGQSQNIKIDNSPFEIMEDFIYLSPTLTNQNSIREEIESRLKSDIGCYHSVQNLLYSCLLSKILRSRYTELQFRLLFYITLREERRLRVLENRVQRKIFGPKREEVTGEWRKLHNEEFNDMYSSPNFIGLIKSK